MTAHDILAIPAVTEPPKLDIYLEVASQALLLLLSERRHFPEWDIGLPIYFRLLPTHIHKRCIKHIANQKVLAEGTIVFDLQRDIACEEMLFVEFYSVFLVLLELKRVFQLFGVVDGLRGGVVDKFDVGTTNLEVTLESDLLYGQDLRVDLGIVQKMLEVLNILDLAGLSDPIAILLESSRGIKLHNLPVVLKDAHE
jgi:hypothetical protein